MGRFGIGGNAYADFFLKGRFLSLRGTNSPEAIYSG